MFFVCTLMFSGFAPADEGSAVSAETVAADHALSQQIAELYRDGRNSYHSGDLVSAEKSLNESYSLWQQARPHLQQPEKLKPMMRECETVRERIRKLQKFEALVNGWQKRFEVLWFPQFEIRDADFSAVMDYFQQRVGQSFGEEKPNVLFRVAPEKLKSKLTLELRNVTAWQALLAIEERMRIETKFEPHAIVLVDAAEVEK